MKTDLSYNIAAEMDKVLNDEENKKLFSTSSMLEKLAFSRVADEGKIESEVEAALLAAPSLRKEAAATGSCPRCYSLKPGNEKCSCQCKGPADCAKGCPCKCGGGSYEKTMQAKSSALRTDAIVKNAYEKLLEVSEELEEAGFDRLAAVSLLLVEKLMAEAKAKKSPSKSKSKSKSKPKMDMKARMKKMREMQGKGKGKKESPAKSKDSKDSKKPAESKKNPFEKKTTDSKDSKKSTDSK